VVGKRLPQRRKRPFKEIEIRDRAWSCSLIALSDAKPVTTFAESALLSARTFGRKTGDHFC
jgi:hypothetical protein